MGIDRPGFWDSQAGTPRHISVVAQPLLEIRGEEAEVSALRAPGAAIHRLSQVDLVSMQIGVRFQKFVERAGDLPPNSAQVTQ